MAIHASKRKKKKVPDHNYDFQKKKQQLPKSLTFGVKVCHFVRQGGLSNKNKLKSAPGTDTGKSAVGNC